MNTEEKVRKINQLGYQIKKGALIAQNCIVESPMQFYIVNPNGKQVDCPVNLDGTIYVSEEKIPFTRREIIQVLYNPSEEEWQYYEYGYSKKTQQYLEKVKNNIGLETYKSDELGEHNNVDNETTQKVDYSAYSSTYRTKISDNKYVVQDFYQYDIDGIRVLTLYFNKYPSDKTIRTAFHVVDVEENMSEAYNRKYKETYKDYSTGHKIHWLDVDGDFEHKYNCLINTDSSVE